MVFDKVLHDKAFDIAKNQKYGFKLVVAYSG